MTMKELIKILGIKTQNSQLQKHPKMIAFLNYINEKDLDIYEHGFTIKEESFQILLENSNSFNTLLKILKQSCVLLNLDFQPKEIARFYNLYNPQILQYSINSKILIDPEYLKYATKEWTEEKFVNHQKVLYVSPKRIILKDNPHKPDEEDYIDNYLLNLTALQKAKDLNLLKEAILKLN